ncbi:MAG: phytanoyl-CoA dioxygenase family protein [Pseudonocardia sp.]|nr:phytanoyl-CoA dioxygenase family protein [Pseudonocardia sp.]
MAQATGSTAEIEHVHGRTVTQDMAVSRTGIAAASTSAVLELVEQACHDAAAARLGAGEVTVGREVHLTHTGQAPIGAEIEVSALLTGADGDRLTYRVTVRSGGRPVAEGSHVRVVEAAGAVVEQDLPRPTTDLARAAQDLDRWGYCLVAEALSPEEVARVRARLVEQAAAEAAAGIGRFDSGSHPSKHEGEGVNQRVSTLMNKGEEFQEVATHAGIGSLLQHVLGERFLLTSFTANITTPGCELQVLHQDQGYVNRPQPTYAIVANVAWMLDDVDEVNGGTRVVPGSHLWDHPLGEHPVGEAAPREITTTAPAGTALIIDGRTWHGAGANRSERRRHVLLSNFCRVWVRQQENPFLAIAPEVEAGLSPQLRRLLGWRTWGTLGGVGDVGGVVDGFARRPERYTTRLP